MVEEKAEKNNVASSLHRERDAPLGPPSRSSGDRTRRQRMDTGPGIRDARSTRVFVGVSEII
jgi:hypothetical protein